MPGLYLELGIPWGTRNTRSLFSRSLSSSVGNQMSMQTKNGKCNEGAAPAAQVVGGYLSEAASSKLSQTQTKKASAGRGRGKVLERVRARRASRPAPAAPEGLEVGGASLTSMRHSNWIFLRSWASLAAKSGCKAKRYQLPDLALKFFLQPSTEQKETGQVQTL